MFWHQCCDGHSERALFIERQVLAGPLLHGGSRDVQSGGLGAPPLEGAVPAEGEWVEIHGSNCVAQVLGAGPGLPSRPGGRDGGTGLMRVSKGGRPLARQKALTSGAFQAEVEAV